MELNYFTSIYKIYSYVFAENQTSLFFFLFPFPQLCDIFKAFYYKKATEPLQKSVDKICEA